MLTAHLQPLHARISNELYIVIVVESLRDLMIGSISMKQKIRLKNTHSQSHACQINKEYILE